MGSKIDIFENWFWFGCIRTLTPFFSAHEHRRNSIGVYFLVNGFSFISARKRYKSFMVFTAKIYCMRKFSHVVVKCRIITYTHSFGFPKICVKLETLTHSLVFLTSLHTTRHDSTPQDSTRLHWTIQNILLATNPQLLFCKKLVGREKIMMNGENQKFLACF